MKPRWLRPKLIQMLRKWSAVQNCSGGMAIQQVVLRQIMEHICNEGDALCLRVFILIPKVTGKPWSIYSEPRIAAFIHWPRYLILSFAPKV